MPLLLASSDAIAHHTMTALLRAGLLEGMVITLDFLGLGIAAVVRRQVTSGQSSYSLRLTPWRYLGLTLFLLPFRSRGPCRPTIFSTVLWKGE